MSRARLTVAVLALFCLAGAGWLVVQSSLLDLEHVSVDAGEHTQADAIRAAADVDTGEALLLIDRGAIADRVERLPWVRDASVSFSLPGTLVIKVREREPVGWATIDPETVALVDSSGRVLDHRATPPAGVPHLEIEVAGVPAAGTQLRRSGAVGEALRVAASAPVPLARRTSRIGRDTTGWVLTLDVADVVRLGSVDDGDDLEAKWDALTAVVESLADRHVHLIDVRAPSVPAVRAEGPEGPSGPLSGEQASLTTQPTG